MKHLPKKIDLKETIFQLVTERGSMLFPEFRIIPSFQGDQMIGNERTKVVFWRGVSKEFCEGFISLLKDKKIFLVESSFVEYYRADYRCLWRNGIKSTIKSTGSRLRL